MNVTYYVLMYCIAYLSSATGHITISLIPHSMHACFGVPGLRLRLHMLESLAVVLSSQQVVYGIGDG
jgi:hypothetical protein